MLKRLESYSILALVLLFSAASSWAQAGNSGSIEGVVKDPSGGGVAGAIVEISYLVSGYSDRQLREAMERFGSRTCR